MKVLLYATSLIGVGHNFRAREIARALSLEHEVCYVHGGRRMPAFTMPDPVRVVHLEPVYVPHDSETYSAHDLNRVDRYQPVDPHRTLQNVLEERKQVILETVLRARPAVFITEYFPFSRWPLRVELLPAIEKVRADNGIVICSLRDVHTSRLVADASHAKRITGLLNGYFDHVLVHADPQVTSLTEHFPWIEDAAVPVDYTGFVSEKPNASPTGAHEHELPLPKHGFVLVSAGGGIDGYEMIAPTVEVWEDLSRAGLLGDREMVVFTGTWMREDDYARLRKRCEDSRVRLHRFTSNFLGWMGAADLSISRAGYNTCMNVLEVRARSVLVPSASLEDQEFRASRLASLGVTAMVPQRKWSHDRIAEAVLDGLAQPRVEHTFDLDGAQRTRSFISNLPGPART